MNNENETVEQVCEEIRGTCDMYDLSFSVCDGIGLADRIEEAHKCELAAKDEEIARLRAAIKPVLEVKLVDEGVRCELTTPCAVCDWWIGGREDDCSTLAVFKAAKECQRIYKESEVANG